jgi:hypothetical protein
LRKDIIAGGFYFLTCWHEYVLSKMGLPRGRVDFKESLQYRWDFSETPIVDLYSQALLYAIRTIIPEFMRDIAWQENKRFAVSLSHDIDYWRYWDLATIQKTQQYNLHTFFSRPLAATYKLMGHFLHKKFFYNHFKGLQALLQKEQNLKVKSTWFLLAGDSFEDSRQNYIDDMVIKEEIIDLLGQEDVALHGSPESAFDLDVLNKELDRLRSLGFAPTIYASITKRVLAIWKQRESNTTALWVTGKTSVSGRGYRCHFIPITLQKTGPSECWKFLSS